MTSSYGNTVVWLPTVDQWVCGKHNDTAQTTSSPQSRPTYSSPPRVSDVKRYQVKNCICLVTHENYERTEIFGSVVAAATVLAVRWQSVESCCLGTYGIPTHSYLILWLFSGKLFLGFSADLGVPNILRVFDVTANEDLSQKFTE